MLPIAKRNNIRNIIAIYFALFLSSGCSPQFNSEGLDTLNRLSKSRAEMDAYMYRQIEGYSRLLRDCESNTLQKGLSMDDIVSRYGEPLDCRAAEDGSGKKCLYNHPLEYFSSSRIYLAFDDEEKLVSWVKEGG